MASSREYETPRATHSLLRRHRLTAEQYRLMVPLYARHGVTEVWLVDLERDRIRAYRGPTAAGYRIVQELKRRVSVAPQALQQWAIDLDAVLAR